MAEIYLIRHAQASFGTADYDRLSPLGRRQAEVLGEVLRDCGIRFDAAYSGELQRQRKTAEIVLGLQTDPVDCEVDSRLNEVETDQQFEFMVPELAGRNPTLEALVSKGKKSSKDFQKALEIVFKHWVTTDQAYPGMTSWADYSGGVHCALADIVVRQGSGKTVAVFTSGGTIATIAAHVLGVAGDIVYKLYEPLVNCSVTRLLYSGDRVSLSSFNDHQFIRLLESNLGEKLLTYR